MAFVYDTFTDTNGTNLQSHTGETGATWTNLAGANIPINSNRLDPSGGESIYSASGSPATAEYDVTADFVATAGGSYDAGVLGRCADANNYYLAQFNAGAWNLYKRVAGSYTLLGTFSQTLSSGTTYAVKLEVRDATKKVFIDGVQRISSADNAITAAGKAGLRTSATDLKIDNFAATDPGGGVPTLSGAATNSAGTSITATLSESGCTADGGGSSGSGGFTLSGTSATVSGWSISGTTLTLTLSGTVANGETVTYSYARASTTDDIKNGSGGYLADFSGASVTNNVPAPFTAGALSLTDADDDSVDLSCTAATSGSGTVTRQLQRTTTPGAGYSNVSGQSSTAGGTVSFTDTTAVAGTDYWYRVSYTDTTPATVYSNLQYARLGKSPIIWGFVGDSITVGSGLSGSEPPPNQFVQEISDADPERVHTLGVNAGTSGSVSGTGASGWYPGAASDYLADAETAFTGAGVTHVMVMLGTNDGNVGVSAATFGSNMAAIAADLVSAGFVVILNDPPYRYTDEAGIQRIADYRAQLDSIANGTTILRGDQAAYSVFGEDSTLLGDGVHPTAAGAAILGELWATGALAALEPAAAGGTGGVSRARLVNAGGV